MLEQVRRWPEDGRGGLLNAERAARFDALLSLDLRGRLISKAFYGTRTKITRSIHYQSENCRGRRIGHRARSHVGEGAVEQFRGPCRFRGFRWSAAGSFPARSSSCQRSRVPTLLVGSVDQFGGFGAGRFAAIAIAHERNAARKTTSAERGPSPWSCLPVRGCRKMPSSPWCSRDRPDKGDHTHAARWLSLRP